MLEAMAHFAVEPFAAFFALGQVPTSADRPRLAQAYILRTADERLIAIHLSSLEKFWQGLVAALDAPELASDPRFNPRERRIAEYETLRLELDARFVAQAARPLDRSACRPTTCRTRRSTASTTSSQTRRCSTSASSCRSMLRTPQRQAVRPAVQFDGVRARSVTAAPLLNQHGEAIRAALARGLAWPQPAAAAGA